MMLGVPEKRSCSDEVQRTGLPSHVPWALHTCSGARACFVVFRLIPWCGALG